MENFKNIPKLYYIFFSSFIILAVFSIISGIFIISELQKINKVNQRATEALLVSQLALDFNVENFHTQLEMWEYAYQPNRIRLLAFQGHERTLVELSERLVEVVEKDSALKQGAGLVPGGDKEISQIVADFQLVQNDWDNLLKHIKDLEEAKEMGASREEIDRLDTIVLEAVIKNENLFDALEFNKEVDDFVQDQEDFFNEVRREPEKIISQFTILLTILVTLLFVLGTAPLLFYFFGSRVTWRDEI